MSHSHEMQAKVLTAGNMMTIPGHRIAEAFYVGIKGLPTYPADPTDKMKLIRSIRSQGA